MILFAIRGETNKYRKGNRHVAVVSDASTGALVPWKNDVTLSSNLYEWRTGTGWNGSFSAKE